METKGGAVVRWCKNLLETFLVEWKLGLKGREFRRDLCLETFLVEWKPRASLLLFQYEHALKPS